MGGCRDIFKEVLMSTLPIASIVLVLQIALLKPEAEEVALFVMCIAMVLVGFTVFLYGVEKGINVLGTWMGEEISRRKSRLFMIAIVFAISFLVTVAEPDVSVFASQVVSLFTTLSSGTLVYSIAIGVAVFLIIAACRIVFKFPLRVILTLSYMGVVALALFTPSEFVGIAFDSGGVTTGPMTVPILLSLGIGICSTGAFRNELDGFGMVGLASVGPILALLLVGISMGDVEIHAAVGSGADTGIEGVIHLLAESFEEVVVDVGKAVIPLMIFFVLFQRVFLRYSWNSVANTVKGTTIAGIGVIVFLTAVYAGFIPVATQLGEELAGNTAALVLLGALLGFLVAIAEPAVGILAGRVENSSGGNIRKIAVTLVISAGVGLFVALGMLKVCMNFDMLYILVPGYLLAIALMWIGDRDMMGIAFDAGGVSTGPMSVAIISSMYTSIAATMYTGSEAVVNGFGIIALIALAPILFLEMFSIYIKIMKARS